MELHEHFDEIHPKVLDFLNDHEEKIIEGYEENDGHPFQQVFNSFLNLFKVRFPLVTNSEVNIFRYFFVEKLQSHFRKELQDSIEVCNQTYFGKLLHNIREDKSYFDGIIDPKDVSSVYAVKPKLDNPRIAKQHGAFLIFGISPSIFAVFGLYKPMAKFNKKWIERGSDSGQRIIIDKKSKTQILQQLESFGFNQATLFPEVDKVASFVKFKYLKKLD